MRELNTKTLINLKSKIELKIPNCDISVNEFIEYSISEFDDVNCSKFHLVARSKNNHAHRNIMFVGFLKDEFEREKDFQDELKYLPVDFPYTLIIVESKSFDITFYRGINQNYFENDKGYYDFNSFIKLVKKNKYFLWLSDEKHTEILEKKLEDLSNENRTYWTENKKLLQDNSKLELEIEGFNKTLVYREKTIKELSEELKFFKRLNEEYVRDSITNLFVDVDYSKLIDLIDKPQKRENNEVFSHPGQTIILNRIGSISNSKVEYFFSVLDGYLILRMEVYDWYLHGPTNTPGNVISHIKIIKFNSTLDEFNELNNIEDLNYLYYVHINDLIKS